MYCELYRCKGRVINGRIYMYMWSHLISESGISVLAIIIIIKNDFLYIESVE